MMKPFKAFDIPFVGLKLGSHEIEYTIEQTFFELFEYDEYNSFSVKVRLELEKKNNPARVETLGRGRC